MASVKQLLTGVHSPQPRQNLLQAAGNVGQASGELLQQIGESDTDPHFQVGDKPSSQSPTPRRESLTRNLELSPSFCELTYPNQPNHVSRYDTENF
jgi:hypothetical protein